MNNEEVFIQFRDINSLMIDDKNKARNELYRFLDEYGYPDKKPPYLEILNYLFRSLGLYPYMIEDIEEAHWTDRYAFEAFKVPVGENEEKPLHIEQSAVLKKLLDGKNIALSAPTSFGKSFIIDAYIAIKKPKNVLIIVPTIALADETRRRINRKFGKYYKIITTSKSDLADQNIFIFPQERAFQYLDSIKELDLFIIDEFYKVDSSKDKERSYLLNKALIKFYNKSKQLYFLAPNIKNINFNTFNYSFIKDIEQIVLDFNTVFLSRHDLYTAINGDKEKKEKVLIKLIIEKSCSKNLIYAGTHREVDRVSGILSQELMMAQSGLLLDFVAWLEDNYEKDNFLINYVIKGIGVHHGHLHRSLAQIILKLFEEGEGFHTIVSTSSIIEGVNTTAENVFLWRAKKGGSNLDTFTYKNIAGRGGRMFRHFVGHIYELEKPPEEDNLSIEIEFPQELLGVIDEQNSPVKLNVEQKNEAKTLVDNFVLYLHHDYQEGYKIFNELNEEGKLLSGNIKVYIQIARAIKENKIKNIQGLSSLKSDSLYSFVNALLKVCPIKHGHYSRFIYYLSLNWELPLPLLMKRIQGELSKDISLRKFFELERHVNFNFTRMLNDFYIIFKKINQDTQVDLSALVSTSSFSFLPPLVYYLEEYGLPRMISKKIDKSGLISLTEIENYDLHDTLDMFKKVGKAKIYQEVENLRSFDKYIIDYFYQGIESV